MANWNRKVKPGDYVYHLGDFAYGSHATVEATRRLRKRLNGHIYLIRGNHEKVACGMPESFVWLDDYREIEVEGQRIVLFHYALRTWHHDLRGVWHLFGHTHNTLPSSGKSFDIGVDCWNFEPLSFSEVKSEMDKLPIAPQVKFSCKDCNKFPCECDVSELCAGL